MYLMWTNIISCLLGTFCLSGLVACESLASCFNSGFVSVEGECCSSPCEIRRGRLSPRNRDTHGGDLLR